MSEGRDPYDVLGVPSAATLEQIATAYRRLARRHHPDVSGVSGTERRMAEINAAWTLLRDPAARAAWDRSRGHGRAGGPRQGGHDGRATADSRAGRPAGTTAWRRGPHGEGAAGPPPGNPRGSVLDFGRHIGWSLGEIARVDPGYLAWLSGRRDGQLYRAEIAALLDATRVGAADPEQPSTKRRLFR